MKSIVSLAQARRGELAYLSLWTTHVFPLSPLIQYNSWKYLVKSCPGMEVAFRIVGFVSEPHLSLTRLFDSVLPVTKLKIQIDRKYDPLTRPAYRMDTALEHVRQHYGTRLTSFKLGVDNQKEYFDQSLIKLVRECPRLVYVRVSASYQWGDTANTIERIIAERQPPPLTSKLGPYERVRTDSHDGGKAS
nr:hypothetical protein BgiMline_021063 [Biomphalaria glabrata]